MIDEAVGLKPLSREDRAFIDKMAKLPFPNPAEERRLFERARNGDAIAMEELVVRNTRLVLKVMQKFAAVYRKPGGFEMTDLFQQGVMGLQRAATKFDPSTGHKFSTYAMPSIFNEMQEGINGRHHQIYVPPTYRRHSFRVKQYIESQAPRPSDEISTEEIAEALSLSPSTIESVRDIPNISDSLDREISPDSTLADFVQDKVDRDTSLEDLISVDDRTWLLMHHDEGFTIEEIAAESGVDVDTVEQRLAEAEVRFGQSLSDDSLDGFESVRIPNSGTDELERVILTLTPEQRATLHAFGVNKRKDGKYSDVAEHFGISEAAAVNRVERAVDAFRRALPPGVTASYPEMLEAAVQVRKKFAKNLTKLPQEDREMMRDRLVRGKSRNEVAKAYGLSPAQLKTREQRSLVRIVRAMTMPKAPKVSSALKQGVAISAR